MNDILGDSSSSSSESEYIFARIVNDPMIARRTILAAMNHRTSYEGDIDSPDIRNRNRAPRL